MFGNFEKFIINKICDNQWRKAVNNTAGTVKFVSGDRQRTLDI